MSELAAKKPNDERRGDGSRGLALPAVTAPDRRGLFGSRPRGRWWRDALRRRFLAAADAGAASVAVLAAIVPAAGSLVPLLFVPIALVTAKLNGLYDRDHRALRHLTADEVPAILAWAAVTAAAAAVLLGAIPGQGWSGGRAVLFVSVATVCCVGFRGVARWAWWRRTPPELIGVVGDGEGLAALRRKLQLFREMHFDIGAERTLKQLGGRGPTRTGMLETLVADVDRIVVSSTPIDDELVRELGLICREHQVKLSVISPLRGAVTPLPQITRLADMPILELNTWDLSRSTLWIKRSLDLFVAVVGLTLLALPLLVLALLIRLDSPGPAVFTQIRAGIGGRPFRMYKLRTMQAGAEADLADLVDLADLLEPAFKLSADPRVTRVGRRLRRLSLDELPQLVNVLLGEMSLVGPRPEQIEVVERYSPADRIRLAVKPGITGPMQVSGRGALTFSERLAVELEYVENPSLARDLSIILHTIPAVARGTGAF